jgi:hypothetical protein
VENGNPSACATVNCRSVYISESAVRLVCVTSECVT